MSDIREFLEGNTELDDVMENSNQMESQMVSTLASVVRDNFSHLNVSGREQFSEVSVENDMSGEQFVFDLTAKRGAPGGKTEITVEYKYFPSQDSARPRNTFTTTHKATETELASTSFYDEIIRNMQEQFQMGV